MPFIKNEHMIETLPSQGSDEAFGDRIGLRCSDRRADFLNAEGADLAAEFISIDAVTIVDQISGWVCVITGIDDLPAGPHCRRVLGHAAVHDLSGSVVNQEEHVQRLKR